MLFCDWPVITKEVGAEGFEPVGGGTVEPPPLIVTPALTGVPSVAPPVGLAKPTVNDFVPANGLALLIGTESVFAAVSPVAHERVPVVAVKSVPATALPLVVAYATLTAPLEPPVRLTVTVTAPLV